MASFRELLVYQKAVDLSIEIYKVTGDGQFVRDSGLKDQCRRASVSIPSNIAEGEELNTAKQAVKHLYYAKGSAAELETQLLIAMKIGYITDNQFDDLHNKIKIISSMIMKFINFKYQI